jgi:uncharacterized membrane protein YozB (DUF420 family)
MYHFILAVHNILRWIILILAIVTLVRAYWGWFGKREWTPTDRKVGSFYSISLDVQLLLGLLLYFALSPIVSNNLGIFITLLADSLFRFFAFEHMLLMLIAVILAHVGTAASRRADQTTLKHRRAAIWFTLSLIAILLGMPWFRPLLPGF